MTNPDISMHVIARICSDFPSKFGVPKQSGLVAPLQAEVVFEPEYRCPDAVRGLDAFSHIWLVWQFSESIRDGWSSTVRPPRLGGNRRVGVFASRSPFRPNAIGLSAVRLERVELTESRGPVLHVLGADLVSGTPILDIKPYLPYADCITDASGGFTDTVAARTLEVNIPDTLLQRVPPDRQEALRGVLACDPRPPYQNDPERVYGFGFAGLEVSFRVERGTLIVQDICPASVSKERKI